MENVNKIPVPTNTYRVIPVFEAMMLANNKIPKNSFPIDTYGTVQSNADEQSIVDVTLYNAHGILVKSNPNSLLAIA